MPQPQNAILEEDATVIAAAKYFMSTFTDLDAFFAKEMEIETRRTQLNFAVGHLLGSPQTMFTYQEMWIRFVNDRKKFATSVTNVLMRKATSARA